MQTFHIQKQFFLKVLQHVGWLPAKSETANFPWSTFTKNIRVWRRKCVTLSQTKLVLPWNPPSCYIFFFFYGLLSSPFPAFILPSLF